MQGSFEYFYTTQASNDITVENIGNCVIKAFNDNAVTFYLWIKTSDDGITRVIEVSPILNDLQYESKEFKCIYKKFTYSDQKVNKAINTFLNNPNYLITQAFEVDKEEFIPILKDIELLKFMESSDG